MQRPPAPVQLTKFPAPRKRSAKRSLASGPRPAVDGALALAPGDGGSGQAPGLRVAGGDEPPDVGRIVRLVVEALVGARGLRQVGPWVTPQVAWELSRPRAARRLMSAPRVAAWRVQYPRERAAEVSAIVEVGGRFHAVALRLESMRGRWRCAAVETTIPLR